MKTIYIAAGIAVAALVLAGLFFMFQRPQVRNVDFAQYQSDATGITFYYPKSAYEIKEAAGDAADGVQDVILISQKGAVVPKNSEAPPSISIIVVKTDGTADEWLKAAGSRYIGPRITAPTPMLMAGEEGEYFETTGLYNMQVAAAKIGGKAVIVIGAYIDRNSDLFRDFYTIASSVQFK